VLANVRCNEDKDSFFRTGVLRVTPKPLGGGGEPCADHFPVTIQYRRSLAGKQSSVSEGTTIHASCSDSNVEWLGAIEEVSGDETGDSWIIDVFRLVAAIIGEELGAANDMFRFGMRRGVEPKGGEESGGSMLTAVLDNVFVNLCDLEAWV